MLSLNVLNPVTKICLQLKGLEPATSCVRDQDATTVPVQDTCERQDLKIEPNSCFIDLSDSLISLKSLHSMKVLLHLGKTSIR